MYLSIGVCESNNSFLSLCVSVGSVFLPACSYICRLVSRSTGLSVLSYAGRSVGHSVRTNRKYRQTRLTGIHD